MKTFVKTIAIDADDASLIEEVANKVETAVNELVDTFDIKIMQVSVTPVQTSDSVYEDGRTYNYTYSGWIVTVLYKANGPIAD